MQNIKLLALTVTVLMFGFFSEANAQADCGYFITLYVRDQSGKAISNANVNLDSGVQLHWNSDLEAYTTFGPMGVGSRTITSRLMVTGTGFEKFETEISLNCSSVPKSFALILQPKGSKSPADFKELAAPRTASANEIVLTGVVYDINGAVIVGARIEAKRRNGVVIVGTSNGVGIYDLRLEPDIYSLTIKSYGFRTRVIKDYLVVDSTYKKMYIDVVLEVANDHEPCGYAGDCSGLFPTRLIEMNDAPPVETSIKRRPI